MPIYEYRCSSCGNEHEALQKLSDPLLVTCPVCHKDTLTKMVSAAGFHLKGSGWYVTDFRNGGKPAKPAPAKTDAAEGAPSASTAASSDTAKPAETKAKPAETKSETPAPAPANPKPTTTD